LVHSHARPASAQPSTHARIASAECRFRHLFLTLPWQAAAARALLLNNPMLQHPGAPCHALLTQLAAMPVAGHDERRRCITRMDRSTAVAYNADTRFTPPAETSESVSPAPQGAVPGAGAVAPAPASATINVCVDPLIESASGSASALLGCAGADAAGMDGSAIGMSGAQGDDLPRVAGQGSVVSGAESNSACRDRIWNVNVESGCYSSSEAVEVLSSQFFTGRLAAPCASCDHAFAPHMDTVAQLSQPQPRQPAEADEKIEPNGPPGR